MKRTFCRLEKNWPFNSTGLVVFLPPTLPLSLSPSLPSFTLSFLPGTWDLVYSIKPPTWGASTLPELTSFSRSKYCRPTVVSRRVTVACGVVGVFLLHLINPTCPVRLGSIVISKRPSPGSGFGWMSLPWFPWLPLTRFGVASITQYLSGLPSPLTLLEGRSSVYSSVSLGPGPVGDACWAVSMCTLAGGQGRPESLASKPFLCHGSLRLSNMAPFSE